jgi:hypothetical protein
VLITSRILRKEVEVQRGVKRVENLVCLDDWKTTLPECVYEKINGTFALIYIDPLISNGCETRKSHRIRCPDPKFGSEIRILLVPLLLVESAITPLIELMPQLYIPERSQLFVSHPNRSIYPRLISEQDFRKSHHKPCTAPCKPTPQQFEFNEHPVPYQHLQNASSSHWR